MKRPYVECGVCGTTVQLTKGGAVPEHLTQGPYAYRFRRCDGLGRGIRLADAATPKPWQRRWTAILRRAAFRNASQALKHDPGVQYLQTREQRHYAYKGNPRSGWTTIRTGRGRMSPTYGQEVVAALSAQYEGRP